MPPLRDGEASNRSLSSQGGPPDTRNASMVRFPPDGSYTNRIRWVEGNADSHDETTARLRTEQAFHGFQTHSVSQMPLQTPTPVCLSLTVKTGAVRIPRPTPSGTANTNAINHKPARTASHESPLLVADSS